MNCKDFERLLADALGDELCDADRSAFETHLDECETCRREYESLKRSVESMRTIPGPERMTLGRKDDRSSQGGVSTRLPRTFRWLLAGRFRYAASVMIAFLAGYAFHAGLLIGVAPTPGTELVQSQPETPGDGAGTSLERAVLSAHQRNPGSSDLAKCLIAMFPSGR